MTQDEIIRMAREAGWAREDIDDEINTFERFAALVAAHERNRLAWTQEHWTEYEHAIAAAEREACAKVIAECSDKGDDRGVERDVYMWNRAVNYCAAAIRARNNNG